MDRKLEEVLQAMLKMLATLNEEIERLARTGQFVSGEQCLHLVERIRDHYTDSLVTLRTVERHIHSRDLLPPPE